MSNKIDEKVDPDYQTLTIWERDYKTLFTSKFINRKKYEAPDSKKVYSYIPGTIQQILIKEGQSVKKGEKMLILESMKMMNIVRVPADAVVKNIYVKIGEKIPKNFLIIEFE